MADIFVSYSRDDRERVAPLVAQLESAGYSVWWDRQLQGGTVYSEKIETEIASSDLVVVVWSRASIKSQWVADEANLGQREDKLLPVSLDGTEPPIGFRQIQTIALDSPDGDVTQPSIDSLIEAVAHQTGSGQEEGSSDTSAPDASIAVLPFVNMSSDPEQEYFSDGISEELLNLLAKISQLHVTARTSSFQFKGKTLNVSKIGQVLGVVHVLEGSVRKAGNRVRITAQLIEVATGFHKWSETYDRTLDDIFAIQDEIAAAIVEALKEHILGKVEAPVATRSDSTDAYESFLQGQQALSKRTHDAILKAKKCFKQSLDLDPEFLPAMIGLADACLLLSDDAICYGNVPLDHALSQAFPILDAALARKPNSEEVHSSLSLYYHLLGDSRQAQFHAERAIDINPNCSRAYRTLGLILKRSGDPHALVIRAREKALHLDPASPTDLINLFGELPARSRYKEAAQLLDRIKALEPDSIFLDWGQHSIAWNRGNLRQGLAVYSRSRKLLAERQWAEGIQRTMTAMGEGHTVEALNKSMALLIYCQYGYNDDASRLGQNLKNGVFMEDIRTPNTTVAFWHVMQGRLEEANQLLEQPQDPHPGAWGTHFVLEDFCLGARLSWLVKSKLGDKEGADYYRRKLIELYSVRQLDPEGVHKVTNYLGTCISAMDGDKVTALSEVNQLIDRFPISGCSIFYDPLLTSLESDPDFQSLKQRTMDHIASEKQAAIESGLLPLSKDLFVKN